MALQAVDLGANKEEEEALYKTVMVTDHRGQRSTLIGLDFKARSDRERGNEGGDGRTGGALCRFARARRGTQVLDRRASVCLPQFGEAKGNFFVAFVALATVLFLFCCPAIP